MARRKSFSIPKVGTENSLMLLTEPILSSFEKLEPLTDFVVLNPISFYFYYIKDSGDTITLKTFYALF